MNKIGAKIHDSKYRSGIVYSRFLKMESDLAKVIDRKGKALPPPFRVLDHLTTTNRIGRVFTF